MNSAIRVAMPVLCLMHLASAGSKLANLNGTALIYNNDRLQYVDCRDSTVRNAVTASAIQTQAGTERFYNACTARFSPDGSRLVFGGRYRVGTTYDNYGIWICDNNGNNIEFLNKLVKSSDVFKVNWAEDGFIYWSEETDSVWRINVNTRAVEVYWTGVGVSGYSGTNVKNLCVSRDGTRGVSSSSGRVHALNLVNKQFIYTYVGGCDGAISGLGGYVIQKETVSDHEPSIAYNTHSCLAYVWVFGSLPADLDTSWLWAVGWPETQDIGDRMEQPAGANNTDDYFVGQGRENNSANSFVYQRGTSNYYVLPNYATDFYLGDLPPAPGARIAVAPSALTFDAPTMAAPAPRNVTVTNIAQGSLGAVTITESASWLAVTGASAGNTQTLTNTITVSGLTSGTYTTTVSVSGGGAVNSAVYTVTLNYMTILDAPSGLASNGISDRHIALSWTDNSDNEQGFVVQRLNGAVWQAAGIAAANATSYVDSNLAPGVYTYRVAGFLGADTSTFSNQSSTTLNETESLRITYPAGGEQITAGTTVTITWEAQNITGVVLELSTDGGETWALLPMPGNGSIQPDHQYWLAYPWDVPAGLASSVCMVRVAKYTEQTLKSESGLFLVVPGSGVAPQAMVYGRQAPVFGVSVHDLSGRQVFRAVMPGGVDGNAALIEAHQRLRGGVFVIRLYNDRGDLVRTGSLTVR